MESAIKKKRTRLIVKKGNENIVLSLMDIAVLYVSGRTVLVVDQYSKEYTLHKSLSEIEEYLDKNYFFRANRQTIVNINFVKGFTVSECNKLNVYLTLQAVIPAIIISPETATCFKNWLSES